MQQSYLGYQGDPARFSDTGPYPAASSPAASYPSPASSYPSSSYPSSSYPSAPYPAIPAGAQPMQSLQASGPYTGPYAVPGRPLPQPQPAPPPLNSRQLTLLAVLVYNPIALVAYLLYLYGPSTHCVAGPFCGFGGLPGILQAILMLLGAGLLWGLVTIGLPRLLAATPWQSSFARGIRALTEYHLVRPLLGIYGGVMALAWLVELFTGHLTAPALIFGGITAFACLRCAFSRDPAPPVAQPTYT